MYHYAWSDCLVSSQSKFRKLFERSRYFVASICQKHLRKPRTSCITTKTNCFNNKFLWSKFRQSAKQVLWLVSNFLAFPYFCSININHDLYRYWNSSLLLSVRCHDQWIKILDSFQLRSRTTLIMNQHGAVIMFLLTLLGWHSTNHAVNMTQKLLRGVGTVLR